MENLLPVATAAGAGSTGLLIWMIKRIFKRLDDVSNTLGEIKITMAEQRGREDLVWREIKSDQVKVVKLDAKLEKAWDTISKLAQPRVSDILDKELK